MKDNIFYIFRKEFYTFWAILKFKDNFLYKTINFYTQNQFLYHKMIFIQSR